MTLRGSASQHDLDLLRQSFSDHLTNLDKVLAEREKSHDTSRQEAQRAFSELKSAIESRFTLLNGFRTEITQERGDYARRDYVDEKLASLEAKLNDSRDDRAMMHVRLEVLAAVEQQVKVNGDEIQKLRVHAHDISTELEKVIARPPQFSKADEEEILRGLTLVRKFSIDDSFTPDERATLHRVADTFKGKQAARLRRLTTLESVLLGMFGTAGLITLSQVLTHALPHVIP